MNPIDIVIEARWLAARIEKEGSELRPISALLGRLADEIERLRAERDEVRAYLTVDGLKAKEAADEIERLRNELDGWQAARDWSETPR